MAEHDVSELTITGATHDIHTLLSSSERDYLLGHNGDQIPVSDLVGKNILIYFSAHWCPPCRGFTPKLVEVYHTIKAKDNAFEVVFISSDRDQTSFEDYFSGMPWLALPFGDKTKESLSRLFNVRGIPTLVAIGPTGQTVTTGARELVMLHGADAYPFTEQHLKEIEEQYEEMAKAWPKKVKHKLHEHELELIRSRGYICDGCDEMGRVWSFKCKECDFDLHPKCALGEDKEDRKFIHTLLSSSERDYLLGHNGDQIPVSDLIGKNILLYFSAHWCPPCRAFTPKLIEVYHTIKAKDNAFEVVFISSDRNQTYFEKYFSGMPWLALPFGDKKKESLSRLFKVRGIPTLVAIGPTGQTVTTGAIELVMLHGADAYPFTEQRLKEIEEQYEEMAKGWPKKVKHALHEDHELKLTRSRGYTCDGCDEMGEVWSFKCKECDFDLHPNCALGEDKEGDAKEDVEVGNPKDVCLKILRLELNA